MERAAVLDWTTHPDRAGSPARWLLALAFWLTAFACIALVYAALFYAR